MGHQLNEEVVDVILTRSLVVAKGFHIFFHFRDLSDLQHQQIYLKRDDFSIQLHGLFS